MIGTILLNYGDNVKQIEEEEKNRFLKDLLEQMGVPISDFWKDELSLSTDRRIRLRQLLQAYKIRIVDNKDSIYSVFVEGEKVGSFEKPSYKLKRDLSELDIKKQFYLEMTINCSSAFEDTALEEGDTT